jgi:hypothetical protein
MPKLAEALLQKKHLKEHQNVQARLLASLLKQGSTEPEEKFEDVLTELDATLQEFEALTVRINRTNNATIVPGYDFTIMEGIARRERLQKKLEQVSSATTSATFSVTRARRNGLGEEPTTLVPGYTQKSLRKITDDISAEIRALDTALQAAGWSIDLVED